MSSSTIKTFKFKWYDKKRNLWCVRARASLFNLFFTKYIDGSSATEFVFSRSLSSFCASFGTECLVFVQGHFINLNFKYKNFKCIFGTPIDNLK